MSKQTAFLFVDVSEFSALGIKPIDGLSAGIFTSMWGDKVEFKAEALGLIAKNTKEVIDSTRTEGGEVVGLPIDMDMHDHRGGAGWIKDVLVDMERKILRFMVEWTEPGAEVIRKNIRRFFSPSVDVENSIVLGGSLTNWPATRDEKSGRILLRPIELSQTLKEIDMPKTLDELTALLEGQGNSITALTETVTSLVGTVAQLSSAPAAPTETAPEGDEGVSEPLKQLLSVPEDVEELGQKASDMAKQVIKAEKRKAQVVEFASRIAGGTREKPFGLKVKPAEIVALVLSLPEKQGNAVMRVLEQSLDAAIDFAEHGVDGDGFLHKPQLPDALLKSAREWTKAGKSIDEFFSVNAAELGSPDNYNLAEFRKEKE